jgi:hypothetical protein
VIGLYNPVFNSEKQFPVKTTPDFGKSNSKSHIRLARPSITACRKPKKKWIRLRRRS